MQWHLQHSQSICPEWRAKTTQEYRYSTIRLKSTRRRSWYSPLIHLTSVSSYIRPWDLYGCSSIVSVPSKHAQDFFFFSTWNQALNKIVKKYKIPTKTVQGLSNAELPQVSQCPQPGMATRGLHPS